MLFFIFLTIFASCKKDDYYKAIVTVKYQKDSTLVVSNAYVLLSQKEIIAEGRTNSDGVFEHTFKLESILNIYAAIPNPDVPNDSLRGYGIIKLKLNKTVERTVYIH